VKDALRPLMLATQLGITMGLITVTTILAGLLFGSWLDRQLGTRPLTTLLFILVGVLAGWLGMLSLARSALVQLNTAATRQADVRTAFSAADLGRTLLLVFWLFVVMSLPIGLGLGLGLGIDRATGSSPLWTIVLSLIGAIAGLVGVWRISTRAVGRARRGS